MRVNSLSIEMSSHDARQSSSICFCLHILYILHILYLHIHTVMYSVHLSAFVCTYFTHSEERPMENVFLWGDNLKDNWWALCKDLQCWRKKTKNKILRYTNWQSERWPVADDPSAKILYAQKENSYHLKPNPGHLINHICTINFFQVHSPADGSI